MWSSRRSLFSAACLEGVWSLPLKLFMVGIYSLFTHEKALRSATSYSYSKCAWQSSLSGGPSPFLRQEGIVSYIYIQFAAAIAALDIKWTPPPVLAVRTALSAYSHYRLNLHFGDMSAILIPSLLSRRTPFFHQRFAHS